jgi:deoxyuridine 5''-triphosphate nucleotidohydrolase (dut)
MGKYCEGCEHEEKQRNMEPCKECLTPCSTYKKPGTWISEKFKEGSQVKILTKLINTTDPIFIPTRKYPDDGGADLRARIEHPITLFPHEIWKIPTGVAVEIPKGYVGLIQPRSGASSQGKLVITGTIDSSYRGEMVMSVLNPLGINSVKIEPEERLGQLVIIPCLLAEFEQVNELSKSDRGEKGFGSSGKF